MQRWTGRHGPCAWEKQDASFLPQGRGLGWGVFGLLLGLIAALGLGSLPAAAQTPNRAGVLVVRGDGTRTAQCVGFTEEQISGFELLARAGFAIRTEPTAMGASVCSVDGEGCGEGESCFCQCESGPCRYWTYWRATPEGWRYANLGAGTTVVTDGVLEAWVWGEGERGSAENSRPPELTFAEVCAADAPLVGLAGDTPATQTAVTPPWVLVLVLFVPVAGGLGWWWLNRSRTEVS